MCGTICHRTILSSALCGIIMAIATALPVSLGLGSDGLSKMLHSSTMAERRYVTWKKAHTSGGPTREARAKLAQFISVLVWILALVFWAGVKWNSASRCRFMRMKATMVDLP